LAEGDYRPRTEALVNVRATLERAVVEGVVAAHTAEAIVRAAQALFYPARSYPSILRDALALGADAEELTRLRAFLAAGHLVDQKRLDALALLRRVQRELSELPEAPRSRPTFRFEYTEMWHEFRRQRAARR
jgi:hypothetical protein